MKQSKNNKVVLRPRNVVSRKSWLGRNWYGVDIPVWLFAFFYFGFFILLISIIFIVAPPFQEQPQTPICLEYGCMGEHTEYWVTKDNLTCITLDTYGNFDYWGYDFIECKRWSNKEPICLENETIQISSSRKNTPVLIRPYEFYTVEKWFSEQHRVILNITEIGCYNKECTIRFPNMDDCLPNTITTLPDNCLFRVYKTPWEVENLKDNYLQVNIIWGKGVEKTICKRWDNETYGILELVTYDDPRKFDWLFLNKTHNNVEVNCDGVILTLYNITQEELRVSYLHYANQTCKFNVFESEVKS